MRIAIYGSSLLSSYWNGAATYYRGILRALTSYGHEITFFEPDAYDRQSHCDIAPPPWCRVVVYPATEDGLGNVLAQLAAADVVIKASGVGVYDEALLSGVIALARPDAVRIFWDVDAPATLADIAASSDHWLRMALPHLDAVLTMVAVIPSSRLITRWAARSACPFTTPSIRRRIIRCHQMIDTAPI
jgi:spore maturation protein CgeB